MKINFPLCALLLALTAPAGAATVVQQDNAPYVLPQTTVHTLHAKELKRDYQVLSLIHI